MPILVLFDIDGTILRFKDSHSKSLVNFVSENILHKNINDFIPDFAGKTDLAILHELCEASDYPYQQLLLDIDSVWKKLLVFFESISVSENFNVFPGIYDLLNIFFNDPYFQLGLLTGNFKENAYLKLKAVNLDHYFRFGAFGSDNENRNVLPKIAIERANYYLKNNNFSRSNTIIIGDSIRDIECAKSNSIPIVCVSTGSDSYHFLNNYNPNLLFENFKDYKHVFYSIKKLMGINE